MVLGVNRLVGREKQIPQNHVVVQKLHSNWKHYNKIGITNNIIITINDPKHAASQLSSSSNSCSNYVYMCFYNMKRNVSTFSYDLTDFSE